MNRDLKLMLVALANAPSAERNQLHADLVSAYQPSEILGESLAIFRECCQERYLLQAVSLLESIGADALPCLLDFQRSGSDDYELFEGLAERLNKKLRKTTK